MAQTGKAPFISAWGFKLGQTSGRLDLLRREVGSPPGMHWAWVAWWLADLTINAHTKALTDTMGTGTGGAKNVFIGGVTCQ